MKQLSFVIQIDAPVARVWEIMLAPDTYTLWTAPFCEGSSYEGSWAAGAEIRFTAPNGDGMLSEIIENRQHEFIGSRHGGVVLNGVRDTESEAVKGWVGAMETYTFTPLDGRTELTVTLETTPDFEGMFNENYPKALAILKELCEAP